MNFLKNCVFIDESVFYVNMNRGGACTPKNETPIVKVENTLAVSHTILGAISLCFVVNVIVRAPSVPSTQLPVETGKTRKPDKGKSQKLKPKGTMTDNYLSLLKGNLDIMNDFEYMHDSYLTIGNAPINKRADIQDSGLPRPCSTSWCFKRWIQRNRFTDWGPHLQPCIWVVVVYTNW